MLKCFITASLLAIFVACGGSSKTAATPSGGQGQLSFRPVTASAPAVEALRVSGGLTYRVQGAEMVKTVGATASATASFNYGNLPSTQTYLFEIRNPGTADIENVTITSTNPDVVVITPASLRVISMDGTASVVPLISVQVIHGIGLNGYGTAATLPMGAWSTTLTASGTDTNNHVVTTSVDLNLKVLVANFQVFGTDTDIISGAYQETELSPATQNLKTWTPTNNYDTNIPLPYNGFYQIRYYPTVTRSTYAQVEFKEFRFVNTGNVDLKIDAWSCREGGLLDSAVITPGSTQKLKVYYPGSDTTMLWLETSGSFIIDPSNVVFTTALPAADTNSRYYLDIAINEMGTDL